MKKAFPLYIIIAICSTACMSPSYDVEMEEDIDYASLYSDEETIKVDKINDDVYTSDEGAYSIKFPGIPTRTNESVPSEIGNIEIHMDMYEMSITEYYMVGFNDYPSIIMDEADEELRREMMKSGLKEAKLSWQVTIDDEIRNQDIGDNIGLFYKGHGPNYYVVGKCAIRENRLYQVFILKDGGYPSEERVESFLGSFTLN